MIKRIAIQGLGSLRDVDVRLGGLTLLLGPNAAGKSMFVRALVVLSKIVRSPLRGQKGQFTVDHATLDELVFRRGGLRPISFRVWLDDPDGEPTYILELGRVLGATEELWTVTREEIRLGTFKYSSADGPFCFDTERSGEKRIETPGDPPRAAALPYLVYPFRQDSMAVPVVRPILELQAAVGFAYAYRVNPVALVNPTLPPWIPRENPYIDSTGLGFPFALQRWAQTIAGGRVFQQEVLPALQKLFPHITGIGFRTSRDRLYIEYETVRANNVIPAHLESDGVNLALFFLSVPHILHQTLASIPESPLCLCLEEPEEGTHPHLQGKRLDLLRSMVQGELIKRPLQVVATTHSVDLVRWVRQDESLDTLKFVEHVDNAVGTRIYQPSSQDELNRVWDLWNGDLGSAWYSGAFGATPGIPADDEE